MKIIKQEKSKGLQTYYITSENNDEDSYIVALNEEGELFCSCPDFLYRKSLIDKKYVPVRLQDRERHCKHIKKMVKECVN